MTYASTDLTAPTLTRGPSRATRLGSVARAETRLLLRNRTAVVNSLLLLLLLVAAVPTMAPESEVALGPVLLVAAVGIVLVFLTYYNLVTTYVARRESLVLQRMRTGELTEIELLTAVAVPTLLVTVGQLMLVTLGVVLLGEWVTPVNVVLPLVAVLSGVLLTVLLAVASTAFTRTPESAQITTLPLVLSATGLSGLLIPLSALPEAVAEVARFLPLTPVVELLQLGLAGRAYDGSVVAADQLPGAAAIPLAVLAGWLVVAAAAARRGFRWAPRR